MAFVQRPVFGINFTFEDRDKNKSTVGLYVDTSNTMLELEAAIGGYYRPNLVALSDATLVSYSVTTVWEETAVALAPETADVERKGVFSFRAANGAPFVMSVPSIRNSLIVDRSKIINATDADVAAFIANMLSSGPLAIARPRTYLGSDLSSFTKAEKHHRGSTRG